MKSMIWGTAIIVIGICVLLGAVFGIDIPIMKILFGLFLLYLGIRVIFGAFSWNFEAKTVSTDHEAVFSKSTFAYPNASNKAEYTTVFGSSELDLTKSTELLGKKLEINSVFGQTLITVPAGTPLRVRTNTVLGKTTLPGKNISAFGSFEYVTPGLLAEAPALSLDVNVVMGGLVIQEAPPAL